MLRLNTFLIALALLMFQCGQPGIQELTPEVIQGVNDSIQNTKSDKVNTGILGYVSIPHNVAIKNYFAFMDSITAAIDTFRAWDLNEYALVHANPRIIDSLIGSDYYILKERGIFLFDQSQKVVLHKEDSLAIPDSLSVATIFEKLNSTLIDVNIPEYVLRIFQSGDTLLATKVRVGQNEKKYLELAGHEVDLRTPIGSGEIIRIEKNPIVINPETGKRYEGTHRDDGGYTKMPIIPWLEPRINGIRYGALIHPTTNPATLGYPYSHGCVGTREADAWVIYYNAPIGTKVNFRYDLQIINAKGDTIILPDIYRIRNSKK